ncbi:hypothetical protein BLS_001050 [Venturia inaequalis]|uniref:Major facilitator superfamily (MFS) profile domain-containing protein n=1 Tax=Venturia inaequalis TaxID=5025 RepID=A0A8H3U2F2_VENIN|nr:hypothetical protein BLS_001050 [Venturia inaequalis]
MSTEKVETYHDAPSEDTLDLKFEKRTIRKVDWRLAPILGALYTICLVDRSNISVARISGLDEDVGLAKGERASIACALEGGFFPGCVYLISSWYKRSEVQKRLAGFYLMATLLSSFGNILAYGIIQIGNHTTWKGWRWIYIVEGAITCGAGLIVYPLIVDFPDSKRNKFLDEREKKVILHRLERDQGGKRANEGKVNLLLIWKICKDWKIWSFAFMYFSAAVGSYAWNLFLPIIIRNGFGFSQELAFVLTTPPQVLSVIVVFGLSWWADRLSLRGPFAMGVIVIGIAGLGMVGFAENQTVRYIGTFLGTIGSNGLTSTILSWLQNNVVGDARRSVSSAILVSASGISGIYSSLTFRQQDAPNYVPGIIAVIVPFAVSLVLAIMTSLLLRRQNRLADRGRKVLVADIPDFRYTL